MQKNQIVDIKTLMNANKEINVTILKKVLTEGKVIPLNFVTTLIQQFISIVKEEPNILRRIQPLTIVGDIHGQFPDLLKVLSLCPNIQDHHQHTLLFLGDYVDRGPFGMEVVILLMALKVRHKKNVIMLRGNHQSRQMTQCFNFYSQACSKYSQDVYFEIMDAFDALPLCCIVNEKYFCVHGGISPKAIEVDKINKQQRSKEIPLQGVVCDLMWADPTQEEEGKTVQMFQPNVNRNCSIIFGRQLGQAFLKKNNLITIIRAHQVQMEGFKQHRWPGWSDIPTVYTIFSAPNYCGTHQNKGAILTIKENNFSIRQYKQQDPKYFVPEKYNAFNFSLPRLGQFIDKFCKKLGKVKTKKVPQLQKLSDAQIIGFLLGYISEQKIPQKSFLGKGFNQPLIKSKEIQSNQESVFKKSQNYYHDTEKRKNDSIIIVNEKGEKRKIN